MEKLDISPKKLPIQNKNKVMVKNLTKSTRKEKLETRRNSTKRRILSTPKNKTTHLKKVKEKKKNHIIYLWV
jgi:hypothetical protein